MTLKFNKYHIITIVIIGLIILLYFLKQKRKKEVEEKIDLVNKAIDEGVGQQGSEVTTSMLYGVDSVTNVLFGINPDNSYDADADVKKLHNALGGWLSTDDDDAVYEVLRDKTKCKLVTIDQRMRSSHGITLDEFLKDIFGETQDLLQDKYERAVAIIQNSPSC